MAHNAKAAEAVNEFAKLSLELLSAVVLLGESRTPNRDPEHIMNDLIGVDQRLQVAVKELQEEQKFYDKVLEIQKLIGEKDKQILDLSNMLKKVQRNLEDLLSTSKDSIDAIKTAQSHPVDVDSLVVYGHRVSSFMGEAPYFSQEEQLFYESTSFFKPPFPDQSFIQRSRLYTGVFEEEKPEVPAPSEEMEQDSKFLEIERVKPSDNQRAQPTVEEWNEDELTF